MPLVAGAGLALLHCVLAQAVTVTASDRTEIRTRVQSTDLRLDAETRPNLRLALINPRSTFSFGYVPTLTWLGAISEDSELILQQAADASAFFNAGHTTFSISESGSYGTRNFRALSVAAPAPTSPTTPGGTTTPPGGTTTTPPVGGTPPPGGTTGGTTPPPGGANPPGQTGPLANGQFQLLDQDVTLASSYTTATITQIFSTRTVGSITGTYEYGGGIGAASEQFLPIRKGPSLNLTVRTRVAPADDLATVADGASLETGSILRAQIVDLGEQWTHRFSSAITGSVLAGAALARAESDGFPRRRTSAIVPVGNASLAYGFGLSGGHMRTTSVVSFAPIIDRFTGDFDQRVQWVLDATWTKYRLSLIGNLSGAQSVLPRVVFSNTAVLPFNYYSASASALYRFTRELSVESGVRAAWVRTDGPDAYPILWSVFVAGTYTLSATYL
jgi:hypothetical protein